MSGKISRKGAVSLAVLLLVLAVGAAILGAALNLSNAKPLPTFKSCGEMALAFSNARQSQGYFADSGLMRTLSSGAVPAAAESAGSKTADYSTTNVQVEGVDEADIVKTDGSYIYTIAQGGYAYPVLYDERYGGSAYQTSSRLIIAKAYPADEAGIASETNLTDFYPSEIFIDGDRLLIFGSTSKEMPAAENAQATAQAKVAGVGVMPPYYPQYISLMTVQLWDISDRSEPVLIRTVDFEGSYLTSRKIGTDVYFVVNSYPRYYVMEQVGSPATKAGEIAGEMIPLYRDSAVGDEDLKPACGCADVAYFEPVQAESFITLASISMSDDSADVRKEVIVGSGQNVYASQQNMYVAETSWPSFGIAVPLRTQAIAAPAESEAATEKTIVHRFGLSNGEISYDGNGQVPGYVLNQFSMDEYGGYFRIATTVGRITRSGGTTSNNVYVLDSEMKEAGKIEDIAPGESIYSARFIGDRGYLVTFKKIDPFFVIDLTDPENPQILGKLKIPGYSDYLHPYDENHIIGIGKETEEAEESAGNFAWYQGIKMAIFDVTNVSNPVEMHKVIIGDRGTDSDALHDHKAFLFDREKNLLVIPKLLAEIKGDTSKLPRWTYGDYVFQGAYVYDISLENGFQLKGTVTHFDEEDQTFEKSGYFFYGGDYSIKRSLYIGDVLYTLSGKMIKMNSLSDLSEIKSLPIAG